MENQNLPCALLSSPSMVEITKALLLAQKEIKHAVKDAQNSHMKNSYATLESVIDATKEILLKYDMILMQASDGNVLTTHLQHKSGEFLTTTMKLILNKNDMQGLGSAITYARRYSIAALLNMSQTDDDGNVAAKKAKTIEVKLKPDKKETAAF